MPKHRNQLRIVGGEFGSRRLHFPDAKGLRPTADRVRETLFNWLQGEIHGKRVLDLFAGSGALGIEALSRGARELVFVERARAVAQQLRDNHAVLGVLQRAQLVQADALQWLGTDQPPFDGVFLDPPFADGLLPKVCEALEKQKLLTPNAWIYLEQDSHQPWPALPTHWALHREGKAGQAAFRLIHSNG
ncbi:MAG: 16S rRNA (guanine(966)-N(2))-methyltransferase RsmD [Novosphingobium sp.]